MIRRLLAKWRADRLARKEACAEAYAQYLFKVWRDAYTDAGGRHATWEEFSDIARKLQEKGEDSAVSAAEIRAWRALSRVILGGGR